MQFRISWLFSALLIGTTVFHAGAAELAVSDGIVSFQVLQCEDNDAAPLMCSGKWDGPDGVVVSAELLSGEEVVAEWQQFAVAENGAWKNDPVEIPAGGPYTLALRADTSECRVENLLAGDLWVLAGQSNMQGVGNMLDVTEPHPQVHMLAMNGEWRPAEEPLHILPESPDPVHYKAESETARANAIHGARNGKKGAGLGLPFAVEMMNRTGRPVGLVCTAHGGTSMDQWNPALRDEGGNSLYGSMFDQFQRAGGRVRGMLWYQGESDANLDAAPLYRDKFEAFIAAVRRDFNQPDLPFYFVQIGRFVHPDSKAEPWNLVQAMELEVANRVERCDLVAAIDLDLDDLIHVGTPGLKRLGARLANLAMRDLFQGETLPGPRPAKAVYQDTPYGKQVRVSFTGVNGRLIAMGRPMGFSISNGPDGAMRPVVYKVELPVDEPDVAVVWLQELPENACLWYGRGLDPCANITDEADMAVPVFGPMPVER